MTTIIVLFLAGILLLAIEVFVPGMIVSPLVSFGSEWLRISAAMSTSESPICRSKQPRDIATLLLSSLFAP